MKSIEVTGRLIAAAMAAAMAIAGCAVEGGRDVGAVEDDGATGGDTATVEQSVGQCITECYYAYYAEPARITLVGECERSGALEGCWGRKTPYRTGGCWRYCTDI